jgi:DNA-binding XRE family transcriptional regulator
MTDIEKFQPVEIVGPDEAKQKQLEAYIAQMVDRRVAELMKHRSQESARVFQPFFEEPEVTKQLQKVLTVPEWHKHPVHFAMYGCLSCKTREAGHVAMGMCGTCYRREYERYRKIGKLLVENRERAEDLIEQERQAYRAYKEAAPAMLPAQTGDELPKRGAGRPKTKPKILRGDPSARVRQLREATGLSQDELAQRAGVHRVTILNLERGHNVPHPKPCLAIRRVLVEALVRALWPE